jgi:methionyl-tRNA formyltransferase
MRTLFIVGTRRGLMCLEAALSHGADVAGVICMRQDLHEEDRCDDAIMALAERHGILCFATRYLKDRDYATLIRDELRPDIAFLIGVRVMVPSSLYDFVPLGAYAAHDSLLPAYRGFAPLNWAIINGEETCGVTLFQLGDAVDNGPIVGQKIVAIGSDDSAAQVYIRVCDATTDLVLGALSDAADGQIRAVPQDQTAATYTCSRGPRDGMIDWSCDSRRVYDLLRALAPPYPGAFTFYEGRKVVITAAEHLPSPPVYVGRIPGRPVRIDQDEGTVDVLTGDGILRIRSVVPEGASEQPASHVIRSVRGRLGLDVLDLLERLQQLQRTLKRLPEGCETHEP